MIVISNSKEEVEVGPQPIVEEQLQLVSMLKPMEEEELQQPIIQEQRQLLPTSRHVEEKELQQPMNNGEVFFQICFEGPISSIILQRPRSRTRTMLK